MREKIIPFLKRNKVKNPEKVYLKLLDKYNLEHLTSSSETQLIGIADHIIFGVIGSKLTRGKQALAHAELLGLLGVKIEAPQLPEMIDGQRVLPKDHKKRLYIRYKSHKEFILRRLLQKYNIKTLQDTPSDVRLELLKNFIQFHFGIYGRKLLIQKMKELKIKTLSKAREYQKLSLIEYIVQDMLLFYFEPLKARLIRSELVTIVGVNLNYMQGNPESDEYLKVQTYVRLKQNSSYEKAFTSVKESCKDLIKFHKKRYMSIHKYRSEQNMTLSEKNQILSKAIEHVMGSLSKTTLSMLLTKDEHMKVIFLLKMLKSYLSDKSSKKQSNEMLSMIKNELDLSGFIV